MARKINIDKRVTKIGYKGINGVKNLIFQYPYCHSILFVSL